MTRTDRYILRQFIQTFFFGLLAFVTIYIVVDLIEHLDDFSDRNVPFKVIVLYYLYFIPDIAKLIAPIAMLLAALFTFSRLDSTHELTAFRSAGLGMKRIALPLLIFGLFVGGGMVWFNGWLVPEVNAMRFEIDREYMGQHIRGGASNVLLRLSPTLTLQMDYFDPKKNIANTVSLERLDSNALLLVPRIDSNGTKIKGQDSIRTLAVVERIDAKTMEYDTVARTWTMVNGIARNLRDPEQITATTFSEQEVPGLPVTPDELMLSQQSPDELTLTELRERIERERQGGRDVRTLLIDYHSIFSFPFAAFIVVFFGIPFSTTQRKGGAALPIALTALISAIYLIFTEVSKTLSFTADVPPVVTAWLANGVFLILGLINLMRADRG
ncbi:MAG: LptF/LptG family permease [Ignavibacteriae bacterium]|nr:LptF/LptG family permease [Ignavibacteriota bacterium]MCB9215333.1 LptF/LptG family permease [Ignavibacteria bacterium]